MLEAVRTLLEQSPMLALFAAVGLGYALGRISIAGFSLGVGAVLFAGLALGALAPRARSARAGELHRPGHVPLRHRHPVREAVLRGPRRGPG